MAPVGIEMLVLKVMGKLRRTDGRTDGKTYGTSDGRTWITTAIKPDLKASGSDASAGRAVRIHPMTLLTKFGQIGPGPYFTNFGRSRAGVLVFVLCVLGRF